jgi:hypothetical protein
MRTALPAGLPVIVAYDGYPRLIQWLICRLGRA